jgi:hypothetical protein
MSLITRKWFILSISSPSRRNLCLIPVPLTVVGAAPPHRPLSAVATFTVVVICSRGRPLPHATCLPLWPSSPMVIRSPRAARRRGHPLPWQSAPPRRSPPRLWFGSKGLLGSQYSGLVCWGHDGSRSAVAARHGSVVPCAMTVDRLV